MQPFIENLIRPHPSIQNIQTRQQSQLLAGMLATIFVVGIMSIAFVQFYIGNAFYDDLDEQVTFVAIVLLPVMFWGNRQGYYRASASALLVVLFLLFTLAPFTPGSSAAFLYYVLVPIFLTGIFFSRRELIISVASIIVISAFLNVTSPYVESNRTTPIWYAIAFIGLVGSLNVVLVAYRDRLEAARQSQLQAANAALAASEQQLERRVIERTEELNAARQVAEAANNAKSTFLSNMSHELRTPLNMVIGYTSSMLNMPQMYNGEHLPNVFHSDVKLIQSSGQHLLGLINDILDLSKIEAGKLEIHPNAMELPQIMDGVVATSIGLLKDKPVQIRAIHPPDLPIVWGDPLRVRQILLNLMSNAVKYTPTGSITLEAKKVADGVQLLIIDTGVGIPETALKTVFDRFEQVKAADAIQGTGLGLDISQKLAQMHGTTITVESEVGKGSTFSLILPLATAAQIAEATPEPESQIAEAKVFKAGEVNLAQAKTVLLVEDDTETRQMLRQALESVGHIVVDVNNVSSAVSMATSLLPDLILLDIFLHNEKGWVVLEELRANEESRHIPVVVITQAPDEALNQKYGVALSVPKPLDLNHLLQSLQSIWTTETV